MCTAGGRLSLSPETPNVFCAFATTHQLSRDQFYGDRPVDLRVMRLEDLTHSTNADQVLNEIAADGGRDRGHAYLLEGAPIMRPPAFLWRSASCDASD
jgi:hypothetical protein